MVSATSLLLFTSSWRGLFIAQQSEVKWAHIFSYLHGTSYEMMYINIKQVFLFCDILRWSFEAWDFYQSSWKCFLTETPFCNFPLDKLNHFVRYGEIYIQTNVSSSSSPSSSSSSRQKLNSRTLGIVMLTGGLFFIYT